MSVKEKALKQLALLEHSQGFLLAVKMSP